MKYDQIAEKIISRVLLQITIDERYVGRRQVGIGSWRKTLGKGSYIVCMSSLYVIAFPLVLGVLMYIRLRKHNKVVFSILPAEKEVGHILMDYALLKIEAGTRYLFLGIKGKKGGNIWWTKQIKMRDKIVPCWIVRPIYFWCRCIKPLRRYVLTMPSQVSRSRDVAGALAKNKFELIFSEEEERCYEDFLEENRVTEKGYVCLIVRDTGFKGKTNKQKLQEYRNSTLENYNKGMDWLTSQGVVVIRMGKNCQQNMPFKGDRVIDYARSDKRSDLLDIMLFARCKFAISTGTGIDFICTILRKPILFVDFIPITVAHTFAKALHIPKTIQRKIDKKLITFKEMKELPDLQSFTSRTLEERGYEVVESSDDTIYKGVVQMMELVDGVNSENKKWNQLLTGKFLRELETWHSYKKYHDYIDPEFSMSSAWGIEKWEEYLGEKLDIDGVQRPCNTKDGADE